MSRIYDYAFTTPGSDVIIMTDDDLSYISTSTGGYEGYAIQQVSGSYNGEQILGLVGVGGEQQQVDNSLTYNNTIFPDASQGVGGSLFGIDMQGVEFATRITDYNIYSDNGVYLDGTSDTAIGLYDSAFYVDGSQGADTLVGTGATNFINTSFTAGSGDVTVDLTDGVVSTGDTVDAFLDNIQGVQLGAQDSTLVGLSSGTDLIYGGSGTDNIYGNGATDYVQGGSGTTNFVGGSGNEVFFGNGGTDTMLGGSAANDMVGGSAASSSDTFYGNGGADYVYGNGGTVALIGAGGTEYLAGGSGFNVLDGATQPDADGNTGLNVLDGGNGTDVFYGGIGTNLMYEGSGTDAFSGSSGTDFIYGGSGRSYVYGGSGTDVITTGSGDQYVSAGSGATYFNDTASNLTAGRFDQIDNFKGAQQDGSGTFIYLPTSNASSTSFVDTNGGTAILTPATASFNGQSEIFVSGVSAAVVASQTHFTL